LNKLLVGTLLAFTCISSFADDLKVADDFKSGDLVSADTFNQIFDTIEKINRTVVDSELVGVWKCSAVHASSDNYNGWTNKGIVYELTDAQVNFTASSTETSLESAYSYSTSSPTPFFRSSDPAEAETGTYQFYRGLLVLRNATTTNRGVATIPWKLDVVSDTRFTMEKNNPGGNTPELVVCDSAEAVPASPTSPTATNNKTGINLAWTDSSSDETGFKVYRKLSTETEAKLIATQTALTYSDTDLTEGQTAYYHVTAYNDNGDSAKSKAVSATLDNTAPTILSVTPDNSSSISHNWSSGAAPSPFSGTSALDTVVKVIITFSEEVEISVAGAASVTSSWQGQTKIYGFLEQGDIGTALTFSLPVLAFQQESNAIENDEVETFSITVKSGEIKDKNGILLAQDYVWSFTVTNDGGSCAGFAYCK